MDENFWLDRWQSDRIGFHQEEINAGLIDHFPGMRWPAGGRIFVPLCGKSEDMIWLRDHGQQIVGVELSPVACRSFFEEHGEEFELRESGKHRLYVGEEIEIFCGDFFGLAPEQLGEIDGVYDRASLIALPEPMRADYAAQMKRLVPDGAAVLLITLEYDQELMEGPPFSVQDDEVRALFSEGFDIELVEEGEWQDAPSNFAERGLRHFREHNFMLTRTDS